MSQKKGNLFKSGYTSIGSVLTRWLRGKECPAVKETQVPSLGGDDPPEEDMAAPSCVLGWEAPCTEEAGRYSPWGHKGSDTTESQSMHTHTRLYIHFTQF